MKKCPYCGQVNEDNENRCSKCYAGLPKDKKEEKDKETERESIRERK